MGLAAVKPRLYAAPNLGVLMNAQKRIVVLQGGTGSSKSYSVAQFLVLKMLEEPGRRYTVTRKTFPALRDGAMRDCLTVLHDMGMYEDRYHNKTENIFTWPGTGTQMQFVAVDKPQKLRGPRRDRLWPNEANEFDDEDWLQMRLRTQGTEPASIIPDFNPSMVADHWLYRLEQRDDVEFHISTYLDNPFLPKAVVEEIELLQETDAYAWNVYGLGKRGVHKGTIYPEWTQIETWPMLQHAYGLDFGYSNPAALVKIARRDARIPELYWHELVYQTRLTTPELIDLIKIHAPDSLWSLGGACIHADSAEPDTIAEIQAAGINCVAAHKGPGSVLSGIKWIRGHRLYVTKSSTNIVREGQSYKRRQTPGGEVLEEPLDMFNHALDAGRYGCDQWRHETNFEVIRV